MYPRLNDTDARYAEHRYRQMMAEIEHRRFVAGACRARSDACFGWGAVRRYLWRLLMRACHRLPGARCPAPARPAIAPPDGLGPAR